MLPESLLARNDLLLFLYLLLSSAHSSSITTRKYIRLISNSRQMQGSGCIMARSLVPIAKLFLILQGRQSVRPDCHQLRPLCQ